MIKDRRTMKTEKAIREAFLSLLGQKSVNRITVSEISKLADLGRGTFYLHYKDVYDLYEQIENELYRELEKIYESNVPLDNESNLNFVNTITKYIEDNHFLFWILTNAESNGNTIRKLREFFYQKLEHHPLCAGCEYDQYESIFTVSGVVGVLEEWINNKMVMPQEKVAQLLHQLLSNFYPNIR